MSHRPVPGLRRSRLEVVCRVDTVVPWCWDPCPSRVPLGMDLLDIPWHQLAGGTPVGNLLL